MAPKKPNPMEEPPAASSSEEEEEENDHSEEVSSSDDDEEEDNQEPEKALSPPPQQTHKQSAVKKLETAPATPQAKSTSTEDSELESESESEPDATPKPIATKRMEETPKSTKPRSKPVSKRPNETEEAAKGSKRAKKKGPDADLDGEQKRPGEDPKKQLFQRLWSEDDEIDVLKGMIEFSTKKGLDPIQDTQAFYDYIKKSLHVDVNKAQVVDKIKRLKKKYENNHGKAIKKGKDPTFSKPHEQKTYDLSKTLWGSENTGRVIESTAKTDGKPKKIQNQKGNNNLLAALKAELIDGAKGDMMEVDNDKEGNAGVESVNLEEREEEKALFDKSIGVAGLEEFVVNDGLNTIGGAKKLELEERWKNLLLAQLELFVQRNELINEQAKLILDAMKSSSN